MIYILTEQFLVGRRCYGLPMFYTFIGCARIGHVCLNYCFPCRVYILLDIASKYITIHMFLISWFEFKKNKEYD